MPPLILVVDDEPAVLDVGKRMLEMAGYEVKTACDGVEAVEIFKEHSSDFVCVILDLTMPKMNGEKTFAELQKIDANVPVVLSSGYNESEVESWISTMGIAGFVQKPYKSSELKECLANVLAG